ncbi:FUN14 domain-containing protein 2 isoform X1 [Ascaphus truei]|uniref:FUN14 domain-containing protein 2 isoform X1 n=1 Tax=Ascaphus truei TaxID=8439 RepID=UPI003F597E2A
MAAAAGEKEGVLPDVLDLAEYAKKQRWWNKMFGRNSGPIAEKYSVMTQIMIGGAAGWCAGFLFNKVGKLAATAVGGGFFLLQIAHHTGYVHVDWKRLEKDVNTAKEQLKIQSKKIKGEQPSRVKEIQIFLKKNVVVTGGFAGGFLLGMVS